MTWWKIQVGKRPDYEAATTKDERDFLAEMAEISVQDSGSGERVVVTEMPGDPPKFELPETAPWD